jgi:hypothetical protein
MPSGKRLPCPGHGRHWFALHGQVGLRSPVCVRCGAPNPRPLSEGELRELREFAAAFPRNINSHTLRALAG